MKLPEKKEERKSKTEKGKAKKGNKIFLRSKILESRKFSAILIKIQTKNKICTNFKMTYP